MASPRRGDGSELRRRAARLPDGEIRQALVAKTHYEALGVRVDADAADIKKAFHRMALKLHPDKNQQELAEDAFKRVQHAHAVLSDGAARRLYDMQIATD